MTWHVYDIVPIDFGWIHLKSVKETLTEIIKYGDGANVSVDIDTSDINSFLSAWESAKSAASQKSWEGDFRHEPSVFWLPSENDFVYGFAFKQDNNGTTFVVSPYALPWLNELM